MAAISLYYDSHRSEMRANAAALQSKSTRIALIRMAYFIAWVCLFILLVQSYWWAAVLLLYAGVVGFGRLMTWHDDIQRKTLISQRIADLCDDELRLLDLDMQGRDTGHDLCPANHPYAVDLDIFGAGSIYALYSRCQTTMGRERLADFLLQVVPKAVIVQRQEAAAELEQQADWVLRCQAEGADISDTKQDHTSLLEWLHGADEIAGVKWLDLTSILLPIVTTAAFVYLWYSTTFVIALTALVPCAYLLHRYKRVIDAMQAQIDKLSQVLLGYSHMMHHIETATFEHPYLLQLQSAFITTTKASEAVKRLSRLIDNLNVRSNVFGIVLNIFTLWDIHYARKLEVWRQQHRLDVSQWYDHLAEIEALLSIASVGMHNPGWTLPVCGDDNYLSGTGLGHPLLHRDVRVCNDFETSTQHHLHLVTGSNMGGKSTFLRTVGLQIALTYSGSKVCATSWSMPAGLQLYTSMRTQDAIQESTSGFYAELRRLRGLIERIESGQPIYYLLDEILKGTNSRDRNTGAAALMRQLLRYPVAGMISTHDTSLGSMASELPGKVSNICFEVDVDGDHLTFDYTLRHGVSQSFNATALMRSIGIAV